MKTNKLPIFPFLFSIYPILFLYARNIVFIPIQYTYTSMLIVFGTTIFFFVCLGFILRNWIKGGLITSLLISMFFSFGHFTNFIQNFQTSAINYSLLSWIWLVIFLVISFLILKTMNIDRLLGFFNTISIVLVVFPLWTIITTTIATHPDNLYRLENQLADIRDEISAEQSIQVSEDLKPDIYMIILDSYERNDQLSEYYHFDNSEFIDSLHERGFFIADQARSNYLNTTYSLNTTLNLVYFQDFPDDLIRSARYNLQTNYVSDFLREQGYQIVNFDSGTGDTNNQYTDIFISPVIENTSSSETINPFEKLLLQTTLLQGLFHKSENVDQQSDAITASINTELDIRRSRIDSAFTHLPDYASDKDPQFLFAHVYAPHIPFLYGKNGEDLKYSYSSQLSWYEVAPENYVEEYIDQIRYLNQRVLNTIDVIQSTSTRPYVILLQSDHGDDHFLDWDNPDQQGVDIRSSILYGVYFSDSEYEDFYPTITSVNTFRVVLNHWFGTSYPLLDDKVTFHDHSVSTRPEVLPNFQDACIKFNICPQKK